jgi:hypothetical protein
MNIDVRIPLLAVELALNNVKAFDMMSTENRECTFTTKVSR